MFKANTVKGPVSLGQSGDRSAEYATGAVIETSDRVCTTERLFSNDIKELPIRKQCPSGLGKECILSRNFRAN